MLQHLLFSLSRFSNLAIVKLFSYRNYMKKANKFKLTETYLLVQFNISGNIFKIIKDFFIPS